MSAFIVTVKAEDSAPLTYLAISRSSFDVHAAAVDRHGLCAVTVTSAQRKEAKK